MWFIGVEVAQETSAPPPKKNPGSALVFVVWSFSCVIKLCDFSFQAKKGYEEMEKLSQAAREQAADAEDKYVHVVLC